MAEPPGVPFYSFVEKHERKESKTDTNALNDPGKLTDQQKLMNVTQSDNASYKTGKEQASYDEDLPDLKSSNTDPERELSITDSEQFVCSLQQSNELDQDQVVPVASSSGALESSPNHSPFVYDEDTMDWQVRGFDDSIVLSDISSHCSDVEQFVMTCPPVDQADNGDYWQSYLLFGQNPTVEWTRSLVMLSSSTDTGNLPAEGYNGRVVVPENSIVEALAEEMEHEAVTHCCLYCVHCRRCYEKRIDTKLHPCCDACLCMKCAEYLMATGRPCPKCNQPIRGISPIKLP